MTLTELAERYVLGLSRADELPSAAADALGEGIDSPSLRMLAGSNGDDSEAIAKLFRSALNELSIQMPAPEVAALSAARRVAEAIVSGAIEPYEGATKIWHQFYTRFPQLKELRPFVGLASEYEDDERHRAEYVQDIIDEARNLLGR